MNTVLRAGLMLLQVLLPLTAGAKSIDSADAWRDLLIAHVTRHPQAEAQDVYKLLVQATLGAEHAAPSEAAALAWMEKELATMGEGPAEPLVEPIRPDGALVRVHLRTFIARGGDGRKLAQAFAATGRRKFGTRAELAERWEQVVELARLGKFPFDEAAARSFGEKMRAAEWPAVHHSKIFGATYRPAYRVVARELLADLLPPGAAQ